MMVSLLTIHDCCKQLMILLLMNAYNNEYDDAVLHYITPLKSGSMCIANLYPIVLQVKINHTLLSTIRAVIGTLTSTSMASNSTSDNEAIRKSTVIVQIVR